MLFEAMGIAPQQMEEDASEHSSGAGRIYARTGGVSEAVVRTVEQLHPGRKIAVRPMQADGGKACKQMIEAIQEGKTEANFFEGMGCVGGCVGGPRALLPREEGSAYVDHYGKEALYQTPLENPYVIELLEKLGFSTVEDFLEKVIFSRVISKCVAPGDGSCYNRRQRIMQRQRRERCCHRNF